MKAALERTPCHHTAPKLILGNILVGSAWTVFERAPLFARQADRRRPFSNRVSRPLRGRCRIFGVQIRVSLQSQVVQIN